MELHPPGTAGAGRPPLAGDARDGRRGAAELSPQFSRLYATVGRPSITPERLLRALLLQVLYSVRSEWLLMEQLDYNLLFRWFVGLSADDPIWDATVFTKNRQRLLEGDIARAFFDRVVAHARQRELPCRVSRGPAQHRELAVLMRTAARARSRRSRDGRVRQPRDGQGLGSTTAWAICLKCRE